MQLDTEYLKWIGGVIGFVIFGAGKSIFTSIKSKPISEDGKVLSKEESKLTSKTPQTSIDSTDVLYYLLKQKSVIEMAVQIRDQDILREQMKYTEKKFNIIYNKILDIFTNILEDSIGDTENILHTNYYQNFTNVTEYIRIKVTDHIRTAFKEDNIMNKSNQEFTSYIDTTAESISNIINGLLKSKYNQRNIIRKFGDMNRICPEISDAISDILTEGRRIALKKNNDVSIIINLFNEEISKGLGVIYSMTL